MISFSRLVVMLFIHRYSNIYQLFDKICLGSNSSGISLSLFIQHPYKSLSGIESDVSIELVGSRTCILCSFLLPWWVYRAEVPLVFPCLFGDEMFWEVMLASVFMITLYISPPPLLTKFQRLAAVVRNLK